MSGTLSASAHRFSGHDRSVTLDKGGTWLLLRELSHALREQSLWNPASMLRLGHTMNDTQPVTRLGTRTSKSKDSLLGDLDLLIRDQQNALDIRFLALPAHSKVPVSRKKAKAKRKRKLEAFKAARKSARKK